MSGNVTDNGQSGSLRQPTSVFINKTVQDFGTATFNDSTQENQTLKFITNTVQDLGKQNRLDEPAQIGLETPSFTNEVAPHAFAARPGLEWSLEDIRKLIRLRKSGLDWDDIARELPGRNAVSCMLRCHRYIVRDSDGNEKQPESGSGNRAVLDRADYVRWLPEETALLLSLRLSDMDWPAISEQLLGRSEKSCAQYYYQNIQKGSEERPSPAASCITWSSEEIALLKDQAGRGVDWENIASQLPRRTARACQSYYLRLQKKVDE
jgi:hypothetical protein